MRTTVSVIIPVDNKLGSIFECIESVLAQKRHISEIIIAFDKTPEDVKAEIKSREDIARKRIIRFVDAYRALAEASGDYIWILAPEDISSPMFLKRTMKAFAQFKDASLFYSNVGDLDECLTPKFSYFEKTELEKIFSVKNIISNLSSVVFKNNSELKKILSSENESRFIREWKAYLHMLELGGFVYDKESLIYGSSNAFKEEQNSIIYKEVLTLQDELAKKYNLGKDFIAKQKAYRRELGFTESQKNNGKLKKIAWFIPGFSAGSGGHRTIFTNAESLIARGYRCDLYVNSAHPERPAHTLSRIKEDYGIDFSGDIYNGFDLVKDYDMIFATSWDTAKPVRDTSVPQKLYFIQDYEPWFFPMGDEFVAASESYEYGFKGIAIGKWLAQKISEEHHAETKFFNFCADLNIYHPLSNIKTEKAICAIFQPDKSRRCPKLVLAALQAFQKVHPEIKIYLYGSPKQDIPGLRATHLGTISVEECNELYNKCLAGLCISLTNPSRIPFEMMAAGLPVVDLHRENNLCDFPNTGCSLAEPSAESIAEKLSEIVENDKMRTRMGKAGQKFMKDYPLEKGYRQFVDFVDTL